jgi:hypothetical protein
MALKDNSGKWLGQRISKHFFGRKVIRFSTLLDTHVVSNILGLTVSFTKPILFTSFFC